MVPVPALIPLTFHWKVGEGPPLVGVAVKLTELPAQHGLGEPVIFTETGDNGFTTILMEFDVAGLPREQNASEVNTQVTTSPFAGANEKVFEFDPLLNPLTFHW